MNRIRARGGGAVVSWPSAAMRSRVRRGAVAIGAACAPRHTEAASSGGRMSPTASRAAAAGSKLICTGSSSSFLGGSTLDTHSSRCVAVGFGPGFGMGYGYGYGYGYPMGGFGGGGFLSLLVFGLIAYAALQVLSKQEGGIGGDDGGYIGSERVAVGRVQVGLLGSARGLQRDLTRIAKRADTSDVAGLQYILQETVLALNRNPDYWVYGASSLKNTRDNMAAEQRLNEWSLQERSKFKEETLSNVGGRTRQAASASPGEGLNELIVVTILVAVGGGMKLPRVTSREELRTALNRLGAIDTQSLMAVEVLWTPQDERDAYTQDELLADYPSMYTL